MTRILFKMGHASYVLPAAAYRLEGVAGRGDISIAASASEERSHLVFVCALPACIGKVCERVYVCVLGRQGELT